MLLTKKSSHAALSTSASASPFVHSLRRGLSQALPTMDRRSFLRRSGLGVGAGLAASQLTLVRKAEAADAPAAGKGAGAKIEVKRTVCTHCSVGCAIDAVVENGVLKGLPPSVSQHDWGELPAEVLPYLQPSRYCPSDRHENFVTTRFDGSTKGDQILQMAEWIYDNIEYAPGFSGGGSTVGFA